MAKKHHKLQNHPNFPSKFLYYTVVTPGLLHPAQVVTFCAFVSNFRKNMAKNPNKPGNPPGLLHFFCIFFATVYCILPRYIFFIRKIIK